MRQFAVVLSLPLLWACKGTATGKQADAQAVTIPSAPSSSGSAAASATAPETVELAVRRGQISSWMAPPKADERPRPQKRSCSVVVVFRQGGALVVGKASADVHPTTTCDFAPLERQARAAAAPLPADADKRIVAVTSGVAFPAPTASTPEGYTMEVKTNKRSFVARDLGFPGRDTYYAEPPGQKEGTYRRPTDPSPSRSVDEASFRLCDVLGAL
jgi:hypothetical protein